MRDVVDLLDEAVDEGVVWADELVALADLGRGPEGLFGKGNGAGVLLGIEAAIDGFGDALGRDFGGGDGGELAVEARGDVGELKGLGMDAVGVLVIGDVLGGIMGAIEGN